MNSYSYPGLLAKKYRKKNEILTTVCSLYEIEQKQLFRRSRKGVLPEARRVCIYLFHRYLTNMSHERIGRVFGLDHSTITHHIKTFEEHFQVDPNFRAKVTPIL